MSRTAILAGNAAIRPISRPSLRSLERQRRFIDWVVQLFERGRREGLTLESLSDFEVEWIGRVM